MHVNMTVMPGQCFDIGTIDDDAVEGSEIFTVSLTATAEVMIINGQRNIIIFDNDRKRVCDC